MRSQSMGHPSAVAAVALAAVAGLTRAGDQPRDVTESQIEGINGRDFAGLKFPMAASTGELVFTAERAWAWTEESDGGLLGAQASPVRRLYLVGDVTARIGPYDFAGKRAAVWLQKMSEPGKSGATLYQVFAYFDQVGTPNTDAAITISADRLPIRGLVEIISPLSLKADVLDGSRPEDEFLTQAESVLSATLQDLVRPRRPPSSVPSRPGAADQPLAPAPPPGEPGLEQLPTNLPPERGTEPIFAKEGIVSVSSGSWTLVTGTEENAAVIDGNVVVQYDDLAGTRSLQLSAERAVIFLPPGKLESIARLDQKDIRGIYLEGDVVASAAEGKYTLRGPRVYYDFQQQRAVLLDAVFWTYDTKRTLTLYLRAKSIRQEADRQFTAESATLANTAFASPDFSLGATTLTITGTRRRPPPVIGQEFASSEEEDAYLVEAENATVKAVGVPLFYWPKYKGYPDQVPLRDLRVETSDITGVAVKTTWQTLGLFGYEWPQGLSSDLYLDYYTERGAGLGSRLAWDTIDGLGNLYGYMLPDDDGTDLMSTGAQLERDGGFRGMILGEHMVRLDENWSLLLEGNYISDPALVDSLYRDLARNRREFTNRAYLARTDENSQFTLESKGTFNDFISNQYLLQTPGYVVQKLPEIAYFRQADDILESYKPGLLSYFSEYRYSRMSLAFDEVQAREHGFTTTSQAQQALGINANQSVGDRLRGEGYFEKYTNRFDTRHELISPLSAGPVNITPYAVGRLTQYGSDYSEFSPDENENLRWWAGAGLRVSTQIQRVDDTVDSRLFDLHRIRHIVEPHATVQEAGTNIDNVDLPVYDVGVEDLAEGGLYKFGIAQTWQTQRGGPGRWNSVDVFKLNSDVARMSGDADETSPIGRFIDYRPELSNPGNYWINEGVWQVSSSLALSGSSNYDMDHHQQSRSSVGVLMDHFPGFRSSVELRNVHADKTTYLDLGAAYELNAKYSISGFAVYSFLEEDFESFSASIRRRIPGMVFGFGVSYDNLSAETSFGFTFRPEGFGQTESRTQNLTGTDSGQGSSKFGQR